VLNGRRRLSPEKGKQWPLGESWQKRDAQECSFAFGAGGFRPSISTVRALFYRSDNPKREQSLMDEMAFNVVFDGYWREERIDGIPSSSGIYCVYECSYNCAEKTVSIHRLLYIGEADNVRERIKNHEKRELWKRHIRYGNELCFSFGGMKAEYRKRVEAAFIFKHRPPLNDEYMDSFPFDATTINVIGETEKLHSKFTVWTTARKRYF